MGQRLAAAITCVMMTMVPMLANERKPSVTKSALEYFERHDPMTIDEFLAGLRPAPLDEEKRARVIVGLPAQGAIRPGAHEVAKMSRAEDVLAYHDRLGLIPFTIIDVAPAFVGLHGRAVILVSTHALSLVSNEEFAALVAHEIGHEFVWGDYQTAVERRDYASIRELELRCDGIAVLTLRRLGIDPERLVRAVEMLTWYNEQRRLDPDRQEYVPRDDRRAFIRAVAKVQWADELSKAHERAPTSSYAEFFGRPPSWRCRSSPGSNGRNGYQLNLKMLAVDRRASGGCGLTSL